MGVAVGLNLLSMLDDRPVLRESKTRVLPDLKPKYENKNDST